MGITYVKYPWDTEQGKTISLNEREDGHALWSQVSKWCGTNAQGAYEVDAIVYAKGIKVKFDNTEDTQRLKAYINGIRAFT